MALVPKFSPIRRTTDPFKDEEALSVLANLRRRRKILAVRRAFEDGRILHLMPKPLPRTEIRVSRRQLGARDPFDA